MNLKDMREHDAIKVATLLRDKAVFDERIAASPVAKACIILLEVVEKLKEARRKIKMVQ